MLPYRIYFCLTEQGVKYGFPLDVGDDRHRHSAMGSVVQAMKGLAESIGAEIKKALRAEKIAGGF
jgi:hypothetical protein